MRLAKSPALPSAGRPPAERGVEWSAPPFGCCATEGLLEYASDGKTTRARRFRTQILEVSVP
jgi:hypothetical protein